jgi:uncharacterized protein YdhG (YjbR/CyaY superfamily)
MTQNLIEAYIAQCTADDGGSMATATLQQVLQQVYQTIRGVVAEVFPDGAAQAGVTEKISWQMPTIYSDGTTLPKGNLLHFAQGKHHIGLYPGPKAVEAFATELTEKKYKYSKGTIQLPMKAFADEESARAALDVTARVARYCLTE